ncbi:MAG: VF530 family protein [Planctomycetia bacterium]|nr:VF530 family protein [Planctomycetia bacterium]
MTQQHPKDPLHGVTLALMLEHLVAQLGWAEMAFLIPIRCFTHDPSIKSSLKFLRRTSWARSKVERLYLDCSMYRSGSPAKSSLDPEQSSQFDASDVTEC